MVDKRSHSHHPRQHEPNQNQVDQEIECSLQFGAVRGEHEVGFDELADQADRQGGFHHCEAHIVNILAVGLGHNDTHQVNSLDGEAEMSGDLPEHLLQEDGDEQQQVPEDEDEGEVVGVGFLAVVEDHGVRVLGSFDQEEDNVHDGDGEGDEHDQLIGRAAEVEESATLVLHDDGDEDVVEGEHHEGKPDFHGEELGGVLELPLGGPLRNQGEQEEDERHPVDGQGQKQHHVEVGEEIVLIAQRAPLISYHLHVGDGDRHIVVTADVVPPLEGAHHWVGVLGDERGQVDQLKHANVLQTHHLPEEEQHARDEEPPDVSDHADHPTCPNPPIFLLSISQGRQVVVRLDLVSGSRHRHREGLGSLGNGEHDGDVLVLEVFPVFDLHLQHPLADKVLGSFCGHFEGDWLKGNIGGEFGVDGEHMVEVGLHGEGQVELILEDVLGGVVEGEGDLANKTTVGAATGGEAVVGTHEPIFDHAGGRAAISILGVDIVALEVEKQSVPADFNTEVGSLVEEVALLAEHLHSRLASPIHIFFVVGHAQAGFHPVVQDAQVRPPVAHVALVDGGPTAVQAGVVAVQAHCIHHIVIALRPADAPRPFQHECGITLLADRDVRITGDTALVHAWAHTVSIGSDSVGARTDSPIQEPEPAAGQAIIGIGATAGETGPVAAPAFLSEVCVH